ncbi:MAG: chemotaxis protein CheA [Halanaerobiales bacterium]
MDNDNIINDFDDEFLQDFIIETLEHLETIEMNVLDLETNPDNQQIVHSLFRAFHTIKGLAGFVDQKLIQEIAHKTENILDLCRKETMQINKSITNMILASADLIGEVCNDSSVLNDEDFNNKVSQFINEIAIKEKMAKASDIVEGLRTQKNVRSHDTESSIIRIPTQKVDNLVDMMGELIITQSQIEQEAVGRFDRNDSFITRLMNMSRIMKEMQYLSMSLRMVSLKSTFHKIARIARDTIDELDKDADFIFEGEDTEIDRNIAEKLLEPLVHLVKNSISHGIEKPELRKERGKNTTGIVKVSAYSNKGSVYIAISDDGNGINFEKVYQKALEKGLIEETAKLNEREMLDLIFLLGFSTNKDVNTVSGRGVGMDVVKTEVSKIGGKIEIDNQPEKGCKFVLKIPINLAVMNGTIIKIASCKYIIPTLNIKQIVQLNEEQWLEVKGRRSMVKVRGSVIPLIKVLDILSKEQKNKIPKNNDKKCEQKIGNEINNEAGLVIVLEMDNEMKALPVDEIIDRREIVVKPMGGEFSDLDYISGASILGDGTVSLILDIETLFRMRGA